MLRPSALLLMLLTLLLASCENTEETQRRQAAALLMSENSPPVVPQQGTDTQDPLDPAVEALLTSLALETAENQAGCRQRLKIAQRLVNELRFDEARKEAREALRLDPDSVAAQQLLNKIGFMLGDRRNEIALISDEWEGAAKVHRQVQVNELRSILEEGQQLLEAGKHAEASKQFQRVVELIRWMNEDQRLDENNRTQFALLEAEARRALQNSGR